MTMRGVVRCLPWSGAGDMPLAVSMDDAKMHLRIDHSDDDLMIAAYLGAAISKLDGPSGVLNRGLIAQSYRYDIQTFPCGGRLDLPMSGVSTVSSVTYLDSVGDIQPLSNTVWQLVTDNRFIAYLSLKSGQVWPSTLQQEAAVSITFTSGFGLTSADIPFNIRAAILLHMAQLYERRSDDAGELPPAAMALVSNYRPLSV